jgi:hypothetical protein
MFDAATTFKEHHPALGGAEAADESANLTDAVGKAMKILQAGKACRNRSDVVRPAA